MTAAAVAAKAKAKPKAKAAGKAKAKAAAKSGARPGAADAGGPPPFGSACPLFYKGCKIYDAPNDKKYRVLPKPGLSLYDKAFSYKVVSKKDAWAEAVSFCRRPSIPKDSPNYA